MQRGISAKCLWRYLGPVLEQEVRNIVMSTASGTMKRRPLLFNRSPIMRPMCGLAVSVICFVSITFEIVG